jgi:hypothetical protein
MNGMPYTCPLWEQAGLETTDKLRHAIPLNAALQMEQEMEDYEWCCNEQGNCCPNCKQPLHFSADCPVSHYGCTDSTCFIADNHKNYDSAPCTMASTFVAHHLKDEDKAIHAAQDEDLGYWQKQAAMEFDAMFGPAENMCTFGCGLDLALPPLSSLPAPVNTEDYSVFDLQNILCAHWLLSWDHLATQVIAA